MRILAIAVLAGSMLHAAEVLHVRDEGGDAFFPKTDGCIVSTFQVSVSATTLKVPSAPEQQQSMATLAIGRFNVCTGTPLTVRLWRRARHFSRVPDCAGSRYSFTARLNVPHGPVGTKRPRHHLHHLDCHRVDVPGHK